MADTDKKDPRFRPFRVAAYAAYLLLVGAVSLLIIRSVVKSVVAMTPPLRSESDQVLTQPECVDAAEKLWTELDNHRKDLTRQEGQARKTDQEWTHFRVDWLTRLRGLEGRCAPHSHDRAALQELFRQLEHVNDLYMTHAVQYAGEVGPYVDALHERFTAARRRSAGHD